MSETAHAGFRLRFLGDPVLKRAAEDVRPDSAIRELVREMKRILAQERGLGLAAQQIGSVWRVALLCLSDGSFAPKTTVVAINPRIVARSKKTVLSIGEGCLSVQAAGRFFRTSVRRNEWVRLAYLDEAGTEHSVRLEGMDAIIAQHECDHLDGKCIVDGLSRQQRRQAERLVSRRA